MNNYFVLLFIYVFGIGAASPNILLSEEVSWQTAISQVEVSAKEYREYAIELGGTSWAGTMYNGYEYDRHRCAIIGRMLGLGEVIQFLEELNYPEISPKSDAHELLIFSISLDNWVGAARSVLSMTVDERRNIWNLDCIGEMGIPVSADQDSLQPNASFVQEGNKLHVYGDIDFGFYDRFLKALNSSSGVEEITLGSGGGSVRDALLAGYEIRKRGLDTTIYGNCFSACPLVFIGGKERIMWAAPHRLGFHQIYTSDGVPTPIDSEIYKLVANYLSVMGVDTYTVISWMLSAGPSNMFEPEPADLCFPKVATFVQRICNANGKF